MKSCSKVTAGKNVWFVTGISTRLPTKSDMDWNRYFSTLQEYLEYYKRGYSDVMSPISYKEIGGLATYTLIGISIAKKVISFSLVTSG